MLPKSKAQDKPNNLAEEGHKEITADFLDLASWLPFEDKYFPLSVRQNHITRFTRLIVHNFTIKV